MRKLSSRGSKYVHDVIIGNESCIYAYEPETKQNSKVGLFQNKLKLTRVVHGRIPSKQIVTCFFGKCGHVVIEPSKKLKIINSEWDMAICLPDVCGELRKTNRRRQIILLEMQAFTYRPTKESF